jgi:hypothetical protein
VATPTANAQPPVAPRPSVDEPQPDPVPPPVSSPKKPPLMNAKQHVDEILARFSQDPPSAISALEDLRDSYAVDSQVMGGLCICRSRIGETEEALRLAREALPLAFERGHSHLTAEIFKELRAHVGKLGLNREQVLTIAAASASRDDLTTAGEAYSIILCKDACDTRAIKGLLEIAERLLREKDNPSVALKVYRFLEQRCSGSPMAEHISHGIAVAERRLSRTPTPA